MSFNTGGTVSYNLQRSDVILFRSAPPDEHGLHSMIPSSGTPGFALPPMATITLDEVRDPNTWRAFGKTVRRRLFVVRVTYRA